MSQSLHAVESEPPKDNKGYVVVEKVIEEPPVRFPPPSRSKLSHKPYRSREKSSGLTICSGLEMHV